MHLYSIKLPQVFLPALGSSGLALQLSKILGNPQSFEHSHVHHKPTLESRGGSPISSVKVYPVINIFTKMIFFSILRLNLMHSHSSE